MDFDKIEELVLHVSDKMGKIQSEDAAKLALIQPFISALGYDLQDPAEVVPEYPISALKKDYVDYMLFKDGAPIILIECKWCSSTDINKHHDQLQRYYNLNRAKFGILTNGIIYKFYADLDESNKMDELPFLEFDLLNIKDPIRTDIIISELKNFSKPINKDVAYERAQALKYKKGIMDVLESEFDKPSDDFVRFFAQRVFRGYLVESVVDQFRDYTAEICEKFIQDKIDGTINAAKDRASLHEDDIEPEIEQRGSKYFIFNDETFEVKFWKDMVPKICSIMAKKHPDRIEELLTLKGHTNPYFSKNPGDLGAAVQVEGTDIYAETYNYTKNWSLHISKRIVSMFGHSEDDVKMEN